MSAVKVYFPREDTVKVHQTRVKPCPDGPLAGYYWYGSKRKGPGHPPKWVEKVLSDMDKEAEIKHCEEPESSMASVEPTEPELNEYGSTEHESVQVNSDETLFTQKESQAPGTITLMSLEASSLKRGGDVTVLLLTTLDYC